MHICLDFIPELLSQPHLEKQVSSTIILEMRMHIHGTQVGYLQRRRQDRWGSELGGLRNQLSGIGGQWLAGTWGGGWV